MKVRWTTPAWRDLDQIKEFVARDNPRAAYELAFRIHQRTTEILSTTPLAGRAGRTAGTRELPETGTPYIVAYAVRDDVEILAVVHGRRLWSDDFG